MVVFEASSSIGSIRDPYYLPTSTQKEFKKWANIYRITNGMSDLDLYLAVVAFVAPEAFGARGLGVADDVMRYSDEASICSSDILSFSAKQLQKKFKHAEYFGVFDLTEYTEIIATLTEAARQRVLKWVRKSKKIFNKK